MRRSVTVGSCKLRSLIAAAPMLACLLTIGLVGCNPPPKEHASNPTDDKAPKEHASNPTDDNKSDVDAAARAKFASGWGDFTEQSSVVADCNDHILVPALRSGDEKAIELAAKECIRLTEKIDPVHPLGVDPDLASGIRKWKEAKIALYEAARDRKELDAPQKAFNTAAADLDEIHNKLLIKYHLTK